MPMPMPIMVASEVDQSGASTKEITTVVSVLLTASPATATRIGSPAATSEPNMMSRMIAAAASPRPSEPISPCSAWTMDCPPRPTWRPSVEAASAISSIRSLSSRGMSTGFSTSRRTCATSVVPSWLTPAGSWNGSETESTCATEPSSASRSCTASLLTLDAAVRAHHDVDGVAGLGREALLEEGLGLLGVRAGGGVVGLEVAAEGGGEPDGHAEGQQPGQHGAAAAAEGDPRQAAERADPRRRGGRLVRAAGGENGHR